MNPNTRLLVTFCVACVARLSLAPAGVFSETSTSWGEPISVVDVVDKRTLSVQPSSASANATAFVGAASFLPTSTKLVQYKDALPFGPIAEADGWLLRGNVQLSHGGALAEIVLNVIVDGTGGGIVAAYTDRNTSSVTPVLTGPDPIQVAGEDGWVMSATIPEMQSSAIAVIERVWQDHGFDPREAGQVILRPRIISAKFPAQEVGGEFVPLRPTEKVWLIQVSGTKLHETTTTPTQPVYFTGKILQYRDDSLEYVRGFYVP